MDTRSVSPAPAPAPALAPAGAWRFTLTPTEISVPRARHAVRELLLRQCAPLGADQLHGVLLILSELVTNAVRHAALLTPVIGVEVRLGAGWVRLAVEDGHPYRPAALYAPPEQGHTGGRGLHLVTATTHAAGGCCGVEPTAAGGKTVWAAVPLGPPRA